MRALWPVICLGLIGVTAERPVLAQRAIPIRELSAAEVTSVEPFQNIFGVRALRDGQLLVNDGLRRQLIVLDKQLQLARVLLDSANAEGKSYGRRASTIIPYLGDSTLFVDGPGLSLMVIDPNGQFARVMAAPNSRDLPILTYSPSGVDAKGNLIYPGNRSTNSYAPVVPGQPAKPIQRSDSAPIVRANFETRTVDTVGRAMSPSTFFTSSVQLGNGMMKVTKRINPMTTVDEWAVLSDGSIAFIRGQDYHIDWVMPDGSKRSTPKMPFDWKALSEGDKQALIDSSRAAEEKALADKKLAQKNRNGANLDDTPRGTAPSLDPIFEFVPLTDIADYYPAIRYGAAKADAENNVWILPTVSAQSKSGELIYDVVNNQGQLIYRVRIPVNRSIAGFGPNGTVYLMYRDDAKVWHLERTRTIQPPPS